MFCILPSIQVIFVCILAPTLCYDYYCNFKVNLNVRQNIFNGAFSFILLCFHINFKVTVISLEGKNLVSCDCNSIIVALWFTNLILSIMLFMEFIPWFWLQFYRQRYQCTLQINMDRINTLIMWIHPIHENILSLVYLKFYSIYPEVFYFTLETINIFA